MDGSGMTEWNKACLPCRLVHATCNGERPCKRCNALGRPDHCVNVERKKRGRPRKNPIEGEELLEKRARTNEEHPTRTDGDGGAPSGNAATFHPSFPSIPLQQQAYHSLFPQSPSPSDSPHSSPSSSSSSTSSSSPLDVEHHIESAGFAAARRHHHRHQHNNSRHHRHHSHHRNHSSSSGGSSRHAHGDRRSGDNDGEEEPTNVSLLINEMRELRKENRLLNEKLAFFCEKVDRRLLSSERKIDSLSTTLTTATTSTAAPFISPWSSSPPSFSASPLYIRKEILKDLPFLLDYDIISEQVPFLIDDLRKAFIVRRIFDPTPEEDLTVPVTTYANPACCALLGTLLHELVGAPCWFALEQPIRAYLTAKSDKPVGDIFLNAVTRKGNRKRLLRLFSRNQVFYNGKGNAKWWISIIDKTEELPPTAQPDSNKIALILNRNRRGGATLSLVPKDGDSDDDGVDNTTTTAVSTSPSSSASSPTTSSTMPSSTITTISSLSNTPPALSSSARTIATPSSFPGTTNFFAPACATFSSPFISTSSLAPAPSPSPSFSSLLYTSGLPGLIGAPIGELADFAGSIAGGGTRANTGGERNEPLDQELQELWALLAPSEREPTPM